MAESYVQVTEGAGKKLHTIQRTIGANSVEDEVVVAGLPHLSTYRSTATGAVSAATADTHLLQLMAGPSLNVYVRRIRVYQAVLASALAAGAMDVKRLVAAGSGGTALTSIALDSTDPSAGATLQTAPTSKGTVGSALSRHIAIFMAAWPTAGGESALLTEWEFGDELSKMLRIPAGTSNGIAVVQATAIAGASIYIETEFIEANF